MNFDTQTRLTASKSDRVTIGEFTESLLKVIVYKNTNGESVGLSYNEILTNVEQLSQITKHHIKQLQDMQQNFAKKEKIYQNVLEKMQQVCIITKN